MNAKIKRKWVRVRQSRSTKTLSRQTHTASLQRRLDEWSELSIARMEQPLGLSNAEIPHPRHFYIPERLKLAPPGVPIADVTFVERVIERGL
jgi:hypothetical protein